MTPEQIRTIREIQARQHAIIAERARARGVSFEEQYKRELRNEAARARYWRLKREREETARAGGETGTRSPIPETTVIPSPKTPPELPDPLISND